MDELLRVIIRIRTTSTKGKPAIMSQSLLASCVEEIAEDGLSVVEFQFSDNFKRVIQRSDYYARVNLGVMLALQSRYAITLDRKSVVSGKSVSVRVDLGGRRIIKKKK